MTDAEREEYAAEARRAYAERKQAQAQAKTERMLQMLQKLDADCDWRHA